MLLFDWAAVWPLGCSDVWPLSWVARCAAAWLACCVAFVGLLCAPLVWLCGCLAVLLVLSSRRLAAWLFAWFDVWPLGRLLGGTLVSPLCGCLVGLLCGGLLGLRGHVVGFLRV